MGGVERGRDLLTDAVDGAELGVGRGADADVVGGGGDEVHALDAGPDDGADVFGRALGLPVLDLLVEDAADRIEVVVGDELAPEAVRAGLLEEQQADAAEEQRDEDEADRDALAHAPTSAIAASAAASMISVGAARSVHSSKAAAP